MAANPSDKYARPTSHAKWLGWPLAHGPFPMFLVERAGGTIVNANAAALRAYGFARDELVGRRFDDVVAAGGWSAEPGSAWRTVRVHTKSGALVDAEAITAGAENDDDMVLVYPLEEPTSRTLFSRSRREHGAAGVSLGRCSRTRCDARVLVAGAVEGVRELVGPGRAEIVIRVECHAVCVHADSWAAALNELVLNAVAATPPGHPVLVHVADAGDGETLWQVQDTGRGMSAQELARLGHGPATRGIGLVGRIVDDHGGLLRYESALRVGTTASILLPGDPPAVA